MSSCCICNTIYSCVKFGWNPFSSSKVIHGLSFSPEKVEKFLETLDSDSATGPDDISARILKTCSAALAHPFSARLPEVRGPQIFLVLTCFMVGLMATKLSPLPGFLVRRVFGYGYPAGLKTKLVKGWGSSLWAKSHPYLVPNCTCGRPPAVGLPFSRRLVAGFPLWRPKRTHSAKYIKNKMQRKLKTHLERVPHVLLPFTGQFTTWRDWGKAFGTPILL